MHTYVLTHDTLQIIQLHASNGVFKGHFQLVAKKFRSLKFMILVKQFASLWPVYSQPSM